MAKSKKPVAEQSAPVKKTKQRRPVRTRAQALAKQLKSLAGDAFGESDMELADAARQAAEYITAVVGE